jgi:hypothetical protein
MAEAPKSRGTESLECICTFSARSTYQVLRTRIGSYRELGFRLTERILARKRGLASGTVLTFVLQRKADTAAKLL